MSREAAIASAQWETKAAAGEWIICVDPKFSYDSGNGACGCAAPPANNALRHTRLSV